TGSAATPAAAATTTSAGSGPSPTGRGGCAPPTTASRGPGPSSATSPTGASPPTGCWGCGPCGGGETAPGSGRFGAADDLGGGRSRPCSAGRAQGGRQLLFGLRFAAIAGRSGANTREVVLLEQASPGGAFRAWRGLGNPELGDDRGRRIGSPVAVAAPDGRVHLFVRNADKGVSTRVRDADGSWGPWVALGGETVQDGLGATVDAQGRVHVFAPGYDFVHHWTRTRPASPSRT
ncbi:PIG-L family deacetylase, partial [Streptomyces noboritoensis]